MLAQELLRFLLVNCAEERIPRFRIGDRAREFGELILDRLLIRNRGERLAGRLAGRPDAARSWSHRRLRRALNGRFIACPRSPSLILSELPRPVLDLLLLIESVLLRCLSQRHLLLRDGEPELLRLDLLRVLDSAREAGRESRDGTKPRTRGLSYFESTKKRDWDTLFLRHRQGQEAADALEKGQHLLIIRRLARQVLPGHLAQSHLALKLVLVELREIAVC